MKRRNIQELWDIMKRQNLQIVGIDGQKSHQMIQIRSLKE